MKRTLMDITSRTRDGAGRSATKQSLILFNWSMAFRSVFDAMCAVSGFIFVDYALSLGVAKEKMGYFTSVVYLACVMQIAGLLLANYIRNRKRFILTFGYLEAICVTTVVLAALGVPRDYRFLFLIVGVFINASTYHLARPAGDEWLATSIPRGIRGRFLGRRQQIASIVLIVTTLTLGYVAQHIARANSLGFALLLAVGGVFGLSAVLALRGAAMPEVAAAPHIRWADIGEMLRRRPFTNYLLGVTIYNLPFFLGVPFYQVFNLKVLNMHEGTISLLVIGYYLIKILFSHQCGLWIDRLGCRRAIYLVSPLYLLFFLLYTLSAADRSWLIFAAWTLVGIADAAFAVAATTALYQSVPDTASRQAYFAVSNLAQLLLFSAGATVATLLVQLLKPATLTLGPLHLAQFQLLYAICTLMFVPCLFSAQFFPGRERRG